MKKTLAAITLAGSIALIGAFPAVAADHYPAPPANAAVSDGVVGPGSEFVFRGKGFKAGEGLIIKVTPGTKPASTGASVNGRGMSVTGKITLPLAPEEYSSSSDANGTFALPMSISEVGGDTLTATGSKIFPVQGPFTFGGEGSKFGVARTGHSHQGQDLAAAEGTPVVSPIAGTVYHVAYQAKGAGYYVVVAGVDGRHYVFMHLQAGSTVVAKSATVAAGQRLANVGNTGGSDGPHLHFEIWLNGWRASKASQPIDPLPELQAWSAST